MDVNNTVSVLEELIQTCKDGQKGYQEAATKVKRTDLKTFFNEQTQERGRFAAELEAELNRVGKGDKKLSGSVLGTDPTSADGTNDGSRATLGGDNGGCNVSSTSTSSSGASSTRRRRRKAWLR